MPLRFRSVVKGMQMCKNATLWLWVWRNKVEPQGRPYFYLDNIVGFYAKSWLRKLGSLLQ